MAYCTIADLIARYGTEEILAIADRDEDGAADEVVVAAACGDAAAEIDARLAGRYRVPLDRPAAVIRMLACDLARFRLLAGRPHEQAIERHKAAVDLLDAMASGAVSLPGVAGVTGVQFASDPPLFGTEAAEDFTGGVR